MRQEDPEDGRRGKLLSPTRRREAVAKAQEPFNVSERRACRTLEQPRSTQRYQAKSRNDEQSLLTRVRELIGQFSRYGYRMIIRMLRRDGWSMNFKRVYRIWKQEGFRVPQKKTKKRRLDSTQGGISGRRTVRVNHVWSIDFIFDRTRASMGERLLGKLP